jgi:predicted lipid carrier protein YhbT
MKARTDTPLGLPLPPPLAALLGAALAGARGVVERLPPEPPSFVLARALDRALLPRLDRDTRAALAQRVVEIRVVDLGLRLRLCLTATGFAVAARAAPPALRIAAPAAALHALASGREDADTLFFERKLVMQGDTDYALRLKNTLDAIGPIDPRDLLPAPLRRR